MKKTMNDAYVEGFLYDAKLEIKQKGNRNYSCEGKKYVVLENKIFDTTADGVPSEVKDAYIMGDVSIVVDDEGLEVVTLHFGANKPVYKSGKVNSTFNLLFDIMKNVETKSWVKVGKEKALKLQASKGVVNNNMYFSTKTNTYRDNMRLEGRFLSLIENFSDKRNYFVTDFLLTKVVGEIEEEVNSAKDLTTPIGLEGYILSNDKEALLVPVKFVIRHPLGAPFFIDLRDNEGISENNPYFTQVRGRMNPTYTVTEGVFGDSVVTGSKYAREFLVTWAAKYPYDFGDETSISVEEYESKKSELELRRAKMKTDAEERTQTENASAFGAIPASAASSNWNFSV